jgi:hypothetical protein
MVYRVTVLVVSFRLLLLQAVVAVGNNQVVGTAETVALEAVQDGLLQQAQELLVKALTVALELVAVVVLVLLVQQQVPLATVLMAVQVFALRLLEAECFTLVVEVVVGMLLAV